MRSRRRASRRSSRAPTRRLPQRSRSVSITVRRGRELAALGTAVGSAVPLTATVRTEVNGAYETLVRIQMTTASGTPDGVILTGLAIQTITQVNTKALPKLNVGRNEIYVTLGDQSDTHGALAGPPGRLLEKGCLRLEQHRVAAGVDPSTVHGGCLPRGAHARMRISPIDSRRPPTSAAWSTAAGFTISRRRLVYRLPALVRQRRDLDPLVPAHRREQAVRRDPLRDRHRDPARRSHRAVQVPDSQHEYHGNARRRPLLGAHGSGSPPGESHAGAD